MGKVALATSLLAVVGASNVPLATFDGSTKHTWKEQNDPVMGGKSVGTFTVQNGIGVFDGEVVDVPFLKAPGFINAGTVDSQPFPDISGCSAIDLVVKSETAYDGYRLSFGNAHAPESGRYAYGYKANFKAATDDFSIVSLPFTSFTDFWDSSTGEPIKTCQDDKKYCPDESTLRDLKTLRVWGEGVKGKVHLEIKSISASGCKAKEQLVGAMAVTPGLGKGRLCPAIPTKASECPFKIDDYEFEPVCITRQANAELQRRRCMPGEKAPYYKDSDGVFRCACCGHPLWHPDVQFDQEPASSWPWPSFHSPPINGTDGLPNVCHRGPGYGIYQRNATEDLGLHAVGEVGCARCGIHLGDYFDESATGFDHYCIDGVCMITPGGKNGTVCAPTTPGATGSIAI